MATTIASLAVDIGSNISGLTSGLNEANRGIGNFASRTGQAMTNVGRDLSLKVTTPLLGIGVAAAKMAIDFDEAMTNTAAVLGITGDAADQLSAQVLDVGRTARAGPQAVAEAFYDIVGGVTDASTHMAILNAAIATSEAGSAELQATTNGLISVMNAYSLEAGDATRVSDIFTRTVGTGVGTMDEFVSSISPVAGLAASVGVGFEEMGSAAAFMTTQGFSAAQAGTRMQAAITALIKPNETMNEALHLMGVESGTAALQQYGLAGTLQMLSAALGGSTDEMAAALGSTEALGAAILLTDERYNNFSEDFINGLDGATAAARQIQLTSVAAQVDLLKSSMTGLGITIGDAILPGILAVVAAITPFVNRLASASPEVIQIGVALAAAAAAAGPLVATFGALATIFGVILSPIGLMAAGVAAAAFGFKALYDHSESFRNAINNIRDTLGSIDLGGIGSAFGNLLSNFQLPNLSGIGDAIGNALAGITSGGIDLTALKDSITGAFTNMDFSGVQGVFETHFGAILGLVGTAASLIFGGPVGMVIGGAKLVASAIENDFLGIGTFLNTSGIAGSVEAALAPIKSLIDSVIQGIFGGGGGGETLDPLAAVNFAPGDLGGGGGFAIFDQIQNALSTFSNIVGPVIDPIIAGLSGLGSGISDFIGSLGSIDANFAPTLETLGQSLSILFGAFATIGGGVVGGVMSGLGESLAPIGEGIKSFIEGLSQVANGDIGGGLMRLAGGLLTFGVGLASIPLNVAKDIAIFIGDLLGIDVQGGLDALGAALGQIPTIITGVVGLIQAAFDDLAATIRGGIRDANVLAMQAEMTALGGLAAIQGGNLTADQQSRVAFLGQNIQAADIAKQTEAQINAQMAAGGPIQITVPGFEYVASGGAGEDARQYLLNQITDPTAFQQAAAAAVGTDAAKILIPFSVDLAEDPNTQIASILNAALATGDSQIMAQTISLLIPEITANPDPAIQALMAQITASIQGMSVNATANANINVHASVNTSAVTAAVSTSVAAAASAASGGTTSIAAFAQGGDVQRTGLIYAHQGEHVLTPAEAKAYRDSQRAGGGGGRPIINVSVNNYGESAYDLMERVYRAAGDAAPG